MKKQALTQRLRAASGSQTSIRASFRNAPMRIEYHPSAVIDEVLPMLAQELLQPLQVAVSDLAFEFQHGHAFAAVRAFGIEGKVQAGGLGPGLDRAAEGRNHEAACEDS
jgi:hypothetical protein